MVKLFQYIILTYHHIQMITFCNVIKCFNQISFTLIYSLGISKFVYIELCDVNILLSENNVVMHLMYAKNPSESFLLLQFFSSWHTGSVGLTLHTFTIHFNFAILSESSSPLFSSFDCHCLQIQVSQFLQF